MTLSSPSIFRNFGVVTMALLYTVLTFGAAVAPTSAEARAKPVHYVAELVAPAEKTHTIIKGVVWTCEGTRCVAAKNNSRPENVCNRLANKLGEVASFTAKGEALTDDKLAKCNN